MTREYPPQPGARWQTVVQQVETVIPDGEPARPNRAARRADARTDRKASSMTKTTPAKKKLSPREQDVLRYMQDGATALGVALALRISEEAVRSTIGRAKRKLGARSMDEAFQILAVEEAVSGGEGR